MNFLETIRLAISNFWVHPLRSGLTMLGVIIGVASTTLVLFISEAGRARIMLEIDKMGSDLIQITCLCSRLGYPAGLFLFCAYRDTIGALSGPSGGSHESY